MLAHLRGFAVVCFLAAGLPVAAAAEGESPDYLKTVRAYADAMIEHGRDTHEFARPWVLWAAKHKPKLDLGMIWPER